MEATHTENNKWWANWLLIPSELGLLPLSTHCQTVGLAKGGECSHRRFPAPGAYKMFK